MATNVERSARDITKSAETQVEEHKGTRVEAQNGDSLAEGLVEVSVVMPCLNEALTVGVCVEKARAALAEAGLRGEVIVADNGSTDDSPSIAEAAGARVVFQGVPGYGYAYMRGFESARGRYIVMADSDDTYDFRDIPKFVEFLRTGADVVVGNRFTGQILEGAMPWLHRYIGNPVLSGLLNLFFRSGIGDAHCGMRAFTREAWQRMHLQTGGMEFASEMVINAAKSGLSMTEVPITYFPRQGESKLHSFRDGWRHLRFMLLYSPTHLYLWPGTLLAGLGGLGLVALARGPISIGTWTFGIHWMFLASVLAILGFQVICLGFFARVYSLSSHLDVRRDRIVSFFSDHFSMESGILNGGLVFLAGVAVYGFILWSWLNGSLAEINSIRLSLLALTFSTIGAQAVFASFFISMMVIRRKGWPQ